MAFYTVLQAGGLGPLEHEVPLYLFHLHSRDAVWVGLMWVLRGMDARASSHLASSQAQCSMELGGPNPAGRRQEMSRGPLGAIAGHTGV